MLLIYTQSVYGRLVSTKHRLFNRLFSRGASLVGICALLGALPACSDDTDPDDPELDVPSTYTYPSRFVDGQDSVSYSGQILRHVLISDMKSYIGGLTASIDDQSFVPQAGDVVTALDFYLRFDSSTSGQAAHMIVTDPAPLQTLYDDVSTDKNLIGKLAGNDPAGEHKDWSSEFVGWEGAGGSSPAALLGAWFDMLDGLAIDRSQGTVPVGPDGLAIPSVYVTPEGLDLQQLIQKFLLGAITFSQGTDDYLDDDVDGSGLNGSNLQDEDKAYSKLAHHWDEAYGYFGAARNYNDYTDDEIASAGGRDGWSSGYHNTQEDAGIDLLSEYNFGNSQNAAKRDRGSSDAAPTDYSKMVMDAFLTGRAIIEFADGELDAAAMIDLKAQRDIIVEYWEKSISSTALHYINEVLQDMNTFDTQDYSFLDHAKHYSEMKGFALGLQFNPRSPLTDADFASMQQLMRDAPVLPGADAAEISSYRDDLLAARTILANAYDFDASNVGDENGENGW